MTNEKAAVSGNYAGTSIDQPPSSCHTGAFE
ncbi:hypothetical protein X751_29615 [Mesorhizobium sp. LNJC395A00]|nr:hypothetical protein X751_29615 [Mesorhizobium sp. LNJC395A00]